MFLSFSILENLMFLRYKRSFGICLLYLINCVIGFIGGHVESKDGCHEAMDCKSCN